MTFASKELVERAVALVGRTVTYGTINEYQDAIEDLARDLAKATELPDNWCAPVGDAIMGEYRPDAEHEAAIEAWRREALAFRCYPVTLEEIDAICDLARRAPRPKPEPRASSALLEAAKVLVDWCDEKECRHENPYRGGTIWTICDDCGEQWADDRGGFTPWSEPPYIAAMREAIKDEEARGPSEVEQLRKERDEHRDKSSEHLINSLEWRRQRDEARASAEEAERERDEAIDRVNAKLRSLREWVAEEAPGWMAVRAEIDRLLANPPDNPPSVDSEGGVDTGDDDPLREWLESYDPGDNMSTSVKQDAAALAELVRRALGGE